MKDYLIGSILAAFLVFAFLPLMQLIWFFTTISMIAIGAVGIALAIKGAKWIYNYRGK